MARISKQRLTTEELAQYHEERNNKTLQFLQIDYVSFGVNARGIISIKFHGTPEKFDRIEYFLDCGDVVYRLGEGGYIPYLHKEPSVIEFFIHSINKMKLSDVTKEVD